MEKAEERHLSLQIRKVQMIASGASMKGYSIGYLDPDPGHLLCTEAVWAVGEERIWVGG